MTYWHDDVDEEFGVDDPYPELREALGGPFLHMAPGDLEAAVEDAGLSPQDLEFSLGKVFGQVGKVVTSVAPTVLPVAGRVVGTVFGGPAGGALGGALGGAVGGAIGGPARRQGGPARPLGAMTRRAMGQRNMGRAAAAAGPAGSPAAAKLLSVINRPELIAALLAMAMGSTRNQVPVGGTPVPAGAFANLLSSLAGQATYDHHAAMGAGEPEVPAYLVDPSGETAIDPLDPDQRAERLLEMLEQVTPRVAGWSENAWDEDDELYGEDDEAWDALELQGT